MNYPSPREIPKAVIVLALFGLLILIASGILSRAAGKAKAVLS